MGSDGGLHVTHNLQDGAAGSIWKKLAGPPRTTGRPFNIQVLNDGALLCSYGERLPRSTSAYTKGSGVFISSDGGKSWIDRSSPQMLYRTRDVMIDPFDPLQNTWYVSVQAGTGAGEEPWGALQDNRPRPQLAALLDSTTAANEATSCAVNPANPDEMY